MKFFSLLALAPVALAAVPAQIYLSPAPSTAGSHITLTAPQANAVLAHHLGVAQYERLPLTTGDKQWEEALGGASWGAGPKMVILLECGKEGCADFLPEELSKTTPFDLPSLPLRAWTSVVTLHLHRLADSLGLDVDSSAIWGLDTLVKGIKSVDGWMGWVGEELGSAIGWKELKKNLEAAVMPERTKHALLSDVDFLDESASTLVNELESLTSLVDLFSASSVDDGPQSASAQIVALHLTGMTSIPRSSPSYEAAATLLRSTLSATLAAFRTPSSSVLLLTLPPYSPPLLRKRTPWLSPFASTPYTRSAALHKRDVVSASGRVVRQDRATPIPVVPTGSRCFGDREEVERLTASCLGRGIPVEGVSARGKCWVCSCGSTTEEGKLVKWAGEGCEKVDLSSDFVLLFFSGAGLLLLLLVSVMLLYGVGNVELPGTLASVGGGMGGQSKRD